jgi:hypothetical protein
MVVYNNFPYTYIHTYIYCNNFLWWCGGIQLFPTYSIGRSASPSKARRAAAEAGISSGVICGGRAASPAADHLALDTEWVGTLVDSERGGRGEKGRWYGDGTGLDPREACSKAHILKSIVCREFLPEID